LPNFTPNRGSAIIGANRIAPDRIMLRFLVRGGGLGIAINLHQHKSSRVILLLQNVETQDAQFSKLKRALTRVACLKRLDTIRFDMNMNVNHKHVRRIRESLEKAQAVNELKVDYQAAQFALNRRDNLSTLAGLNGRAMETGRTRNQPRRKKAR